MRHLNQPRRRTLGCIGAFALSVAALGFGSTASAADPTPVNVSYQVTIHGVPLQIAEDRGWWAEAGLKPGNMTSFVAGAQQVAAVPSKTWDIGLMGGPPALLGASRFDLQTVLILIDDSRANGVVARTKAFDAIKADAGKAMKGKQYLVPANSTSDYAAQACFAKLGLKPGDMQAVNIAPGAIVDAFKGSDIPIGAVWYPHFARMEKEGGKLLCDGKSAGVLVTGNMVVRPEYLKDNLDAVARFAAMFLRGMNVMRDDRSATLASMKKFYDKGGVSLSPEEMKGEIDTRSYWSLDEQLKAFDRSSGTSMLDKESTRLAEFFKSAGTISKVMDAKAYVNPVVLDYINKNPKLKAFAEGKPGAL
ncbi:ABC transporter substrate-binding protein [Variovorax guangxiensis]|uniref:Nitrate ABC transporter substrate-binding protein n=1 Tax=Variovorax guangxiensis TaxID=1775474 RepID=A0A502DEQ1_9BURK|nr:ABC transporter substrate-binding protein [Variovorax guangxiensis]TPG23494.1 nitrate ABC transporter substrate-binding protein [Variovorax guangxiensis]TPG24047.1 nitrate ABC transporter substrate-binding protein [Variovorax ginsengisoli]